MAAPRIPRMLRRRPMRVEKQTSPRQQGLSASRPAARRFSVVGLAVVCLSVLCLAVIGPPAPARATQGLSPLGGSMVSPAPVFPIRAAGRLLTPTSLKSRSPRAAFAASQQRRPLLPATLPKSAVHTAAGSSASVSPAARPAASVHSAGGAHRTALRRTPVLRPKARH